MGLRIFDLATELARELLAAIEWRAARAIAAGYRADVNRRAKAWIAQGSLETAAAVSGQLHVDAEVVVKRLAAHRALLLAALLLATAGLPELALTLFLLFLACGQFRIDRTASKKGASSGQGPEGLASVTMSSEVHDDAIECAAVLVAIPFATDDGFDAEITLLSRSRRIFDSIGDS